MSNPIFSKAAWLGMRMIAATAAVLTAMALTIFDAKAQSSYDEPAYDDGSYPSDSQGGYKNTDDEDGYEDGQDAPDVAYFYDELEDDGEWLSHADYGQVWRPRNVDEDWRPYTRGTWANTEEHGWYWVSDEPFGWATYHYGRWFLDTRYGWLWVPGTRWAPAWVTWRSSDEFVGWAPLPPEAYWQHGSGLRFETRIYEEERYRPYWSFVEYRYISTPRIHTYCAPRPRLTTIFFSSRPAESYGFVNRRIFNRGVPVSRFERVTRQRFHPLRVRAFEDRSYRRGKREQNVLNIFRPKLTRAIIKERREDRPHFDRGKFRDVDKRPVRGEGRPRQVKLPDNDRNGRPEPPRSDRQWSGRPPHGGFRERDRDRDQERGDRPDRTERPDRQERQDRPQRPERTGRSDVPNLPDRSGPNGRDPSRDPKGRPEIQGRPPRDAGIPAPPAPFGIPTQKRQPTGFEPNPPRVEDRRSREQDRPERAERPDRTERQGRPERSERSERQDRGESPPRRDQVSAPPQGQPNKAAGRDGDRGGENGGKRDRRGNGQGQEVDDRPGGR